MKNKERYYIPMFQVFDAADVIVTSGLDDNGSSNDTIDPNNIESLEISF